MITSRPFDYSIHMPGQTGIGTKILADGISICTFTPETDATAVQRYIAIANDKYDAELCRLAKLVEERRAWNFANMDAPLAQKKHPCFSQLERLRNKIQREAGIVNT